MFSTLTRRTFRAAGVVALFSTLVACGSSDDRETTPECTGRECDGGSAGSGSTGEALLDCPELCREVEACSGETNAACGTQCENTLTMADSLGCGPDYAGYVNCVLDAGDACARERPAECTLAYTDLDACLCAAVPEDCPE